MNTVRMIVATLVVALVLGCVVNDAYAAATPIATATQVDAQTFIFDASASPCKWRYCTFSWRYYGVGTNRLGATLGFGPIVTYTFRTPGYHSVVVTESEFCNAVAGGSNRTCPGDAQVGVVSS